ncbi:MAG: Hsp20/alpha crystallin family protein [Planctomycetaceae bacterium]
MNWNTLLHPAGSPFVALRRDFERQLGLDSHPAYAGMSVLEFEDRWEIRVDVPGLKESDISITMADGGLVVEGERVELKPEGAAELFNDRAKGKFRRVLKVRDQVDASNIDAELNDGVLLVTLRRNPEAGTRKIAIRSKSNGQCNG